MKGSSVPVLAGRANNTPDWIRRALVRFEPYLRTQNGSYAVHYADGQPRKLKLTIDVTPETLEDLERYLRI
jgi:hypothetical protein